MESHIIKQQLNKQLYTFLNFLTNYKMTMNSLHLNWGDQLADMIRNYQKDSLFSYVFVY